jgi:hypothetical protein
VTIVVKIDPATGIIVLDAHLADGPAPRVELDIVRAGKGGKAPHPRRSCCM